MSDFYQKRATLEDYKGKGSLSIDSNNIFHSSTKENGHGPEEQSSQDKPHYSDQSNPKKDIHYHDEICDICGEIECTSTECAAINARLPNPNVFQEIKADEEEIPQRQVNFDTNNEMSYNNVLNLELKERKSAPPQMPQFPTFPSTTIEGTLRKKVGFPGLVSKLTLGRKGTFQEEINKVTSKLKPAQSDEDKKMLEENIKLQEEIDRMRKIRSGDASHAELQYDSDEDPIFKRDTENIEEIKANIAKENDNMLSSMSPQEIQKLREELLSKLDPKLVKKMESKVQEKRSMEIQTKTKQKYTEEEKLEWTKDVDPNQRDTTNEPRYDFDGRVIEIQPETYDSSLYHHGVDQHRAGYTISEIIYLCRSSFAGQKIINLDMLSKIISNQRSSNFDEYFKGLYIKLIDEYQLPVLLVLSLKEKNVNVVRAALSLLISFIHFPENEKWLSHLEKHTIHGLAEAPLLKPSSNVDPDIIVESTLKMKNVTGTAKHDLLKAFVDMEILDSIYRICLSLDEYVRSNVCELLLDVLCDLSLHSHEIAFKVLEQVLLKNFNTNSSVLDKIYEIDPIRTLRLLRYVLRYSRHDCKTVMKQHFSILIGGQISLAALSAGDKTKFDLYKQQNLLLKLIIGRGELKQFIPDTFNYISIIIRRIFDKNPSIQNLELISDLFDLLEAYSRANPTDQICHLRMFVETDCILIIKELHKILQEARKTNSTDRYHLYFQVFGSCIQFCSSFYSSIVHCTAHKQHTIDSIQRVEHVFITTQQDSIAKILKEQFNDILKSMKYETPFDYTKLHYPENLSSFPVNLLPNVNRDLYFHVLTSLLRLVFYLVQGFPTTRKVFITEWLSNRLRDGKELYNRIISQQVQLYEGNIYIQKYTNQVISQYGSLLLDNHFLIHGYADDSCLSHPKEELPFFLNLAYTTTSLKVFHECAKRICWNRFDLIEKDSQLLQDNPADWIFCSLEKVYRNHELEPANIQVLIQSIQLLNIIEEFAPIYFTQFISPLIQLVNVIKILLSLSNDDPLSANDKLVEHLDIYAKQFYSKYFEVQSQENTMKSYIEENNVEHINTIVQELLTSYKSNSFNHPTFFAFVCIFLDSMWPKSIQVLVIKQIDIFRMKLPPDVGSIVENTSEFTEEISDVQFVDYLLYENSGLIGCTARDAPLYKYFTKRIAKFLSSSKFYRDQYKEDLSEYPHLLEDLSLNE